MAPQTLNFCSVPLQFGKDEKYIRCVCVCVYMHFLKQHLCHEIPQSLLKSFSPLQFFQNDPETIRDFV